MAVFEKELLSKGFVSKLREPKSVRGTAKWKFSMLLYELNAPKSLPRSGWGLYCKENLHKFIMNEKNKVRC